MPDILWPPKADADGLAANTPAPNYAGEIVCDRDGTLWTARRVAGALTWKKATSDTDDAVAAISETIPVVGTSLGNVIPVVDAQIDPESDPIPALPPLSARNLLDIETILPPPPQVWVSVPTRPNSPGELGQRAQDGVYEYEYVPPGVWRREVLDVVWENPGFVGPNIASSMVLAGSSYIRDISNRFDGIGLTYSLIGAPEWMSIDASGVISGVAEIGDWSVVVRASVGGESFDSNAFSLTVYALVEDDFEARDLGAFVGPATYGDGAFAVREDTPLALPAGAGTKMVGTSGNATSSIRWAEAVLPLIPKVGDRWEALAVVAVNTVSCRVSVGFMDGAAAAASAVAKVMFQFDNPSPPRVRMLGTAIPSNGDTTVTPADWLNKWIVVNIGYDGTNVRYRFWELGTERPDWFASASRAFTYPATLSANAGLGFSMNSQWSESVNRPRMAYFAASINGQSLSPPEWSAAEFPAIPVGALEYLNAMPEVAREVSRLDEWFADRPYPLRAVGDHWGDYYDDSMIAMLDLFACTSNAPFGSTEIAASDTLLLKKQTTQEYQLNQNTIFHGQLTNALSMYTSHAERRLCPKHVAFREGTTIVGALSASGSNSAETFAVADASRITVGRHAFIRPAVGNWGTTANWEWVYVTAANTATNQITVTRGWAAPAVQSPSNQKSHGAGSYICSVIMGGAINPDATSNGNPTKVSFNWRWNIADDCPPDSNGKIMREHIVDWVDEVFEEINSTYGRYPDGLYDDVDHSYPDPSISRGMDIDNNGALDYGIIGADPATARTAWRDGVAALENAILARVGPGTTADAAFFMNGDWVCPAVNYNGSEVEGGYGDAHWATNQNWSRVDFKTRVHEYNNTRYGNGPRASVNLCRIYTEIWPHMQESRVVSYGGRNADFRLSYTLSQCLGSFFAMPMSANRFNHFDEFAADPNNDFVCPAWGADPADSPNKAAIKALRHWMGKPLGQFVRHYNAAVTNRAADLGAMSWASGLPAVNLNTASAQYFATGGPASVPYAGYGRYSATTVNNLNYGTPRVAKTVSGLTAGQDYTISITLRSSTHRMQEFTIGSVSSLIPTGPEWTTYVFQHRATATSVYLTIGFGRTLGHLDIAEWLIMPGASYGLSRDYEKALVLSNPGPSSYGFTLPVGASYRKLNGTQDPTINNGDPVSGSIVVPARDGLVLGKVF